MSATFNGFVTWLMNAIFGRARYRVKFQYKDGTRLVFEGDGLLKLKSIFEDSNLKNPTLVHRLQIACELAGLTK